MPDGVPWPTRNWARLIDGREEASNGDAAHVHASGELPRSGTAASAPSAAPGQGNAEEWLTTDRQALVPGPPDARLPQVRIRLVYQKLERARFLGNRELTVTFVRACRRAGLPLAFSTGHHPLPRMGFGPALSLGFGSLGEFMDVDLTEARSADEVMAALNRELPEGLTVIEAEALAPTALSIDRRLRAFSYSVSLRQLRPGAVSDDDVAARVADYVQAASFPVEKRIKGVLRRLDARPLVNVSRTSPRELLVETQVTRAGTIKPHHFVAELLGLSSVDTHLLQVLKVGTTLTDAVLS
jgi:radical SAM-linked protein